MNAHPEALRLADRLDLWGDQGDLLEAAAELRRLHAQSDALRQIVDEQAEDEGLWFVAQTAPEAYLQQALRRLHAAVEGEK